MSSDIFRGVQARDLLRGRYILFFGDSNMRALYKDLIWLMEDGALIPQSKLKEKNEDSFANDKRISNGELHNGRDYEEVREYGRNPYIKFHFITRLFSYDFVRAIQKLESLEFKLDVIVIGSCVWDLTRWGPTGVEAYKENLYKTFEFLTSRLETRIIWTTALPPTSECKGGFLTRDVNFLRPFLPYHVMEANHYAATLANKFNIDVLDFHYRFKFMFEGHSPDGIHWLPKYVRYATNMLLTHLALCWNQLLPMNVLLDQDFLRRSEKVLCMENPGNNPCFL